jgi:hypothetical protein
MVLAAAAKPPSMDSTLPQFLEGHFDMLAAALDSVESRTLDLSANLAAANHQSQQDRERWAGKVPVVQPNTADTLAVYIHHETMDNTRSCVAKKRNTKRVTGQFERAMPTVLPPLTPRTSRSSSMHTS